MSLDNNILHLTEQFVKLAIDTQDSLEQQILDLRKKAAAESLDRERYEFALRKAADALYDTDFLTDEYEKRTFLKKAAEDPIYVVRLLEKVCEAADVAPIGKPARVAAKPKEAEYDPVMARAFGWRANSIVDD
jgi:hypothetical protein